MKYAALVLGLFLSTSSCASNPNVPPQIAQLQMVDEAVIAVGTLQHAVIELNKIQTGEPPHPLVSDTDTRTVVDAVADALTVLKQAPAGWRATVQTLITRVEGRLSADARRRASPYLAALRVFLQGGA